ncbi:DUF4224 domain-containing protein [Photobacterium galatheae]|uniref:Uncharacterized protein n=1 Tax=Photobacterium galatheae TaxID=1654360 RepID=A0A066RQZ0_9GAMM|nr:DUF4224 domain-containing protein [Photobacterium galatheae]KDM92865.1 hypothetical protein EA58_03670 [Photobacterium galatheae]MCM0148170.1 DUF4224 domain-containing protein [Photobacterium galatheae]
MEALTKEELFEVTGYQIPSQQYRVLIDSGVFAIFKKPTNSVFTTWHHVLHPNVTPIKVESKHDDEPDFGALRSA